MQNYKNLYLRHFCRGFEIISISAQVDYPIKADQGATALLKCIATFFYIKILPAGFFC